jgi:hypothetical protein
MELIAACGFEMTDPGIEPHSPTRAIIVVLTLASASGR